MQQYKSLDVFKFTAALLVVALHTHFLCETEMGYYFRCLCRIAVPFFFVCSSFLFWKKKSSIKTYTKRILLLYIIWLFIFMPYVVKTFFVNDQSFLHSFLLFLHGLLFHNTFHASWYLMSSVIAMNLVYYLSRRFSNRSMLFIGIGLYILSLLSSSYYGVIDTIGVGEYYSKFDLIFVPSNSFFVAFIYIVLGKIIAELKVVLNKPTTALLSSVFLVIGVAEIFLVRSFTRLTDAFIFLPFFTYFFFQWLLRTDVTVNDELCRLLRRMSIVIYLCHYFFIDLHLSIGMELGSLLFLVVTIEAVTISAIIVFLSNKFKPLRYLY